MSVQLSNTATINAYDLTPGDRIAYNGTTVRILRDGEDHLDFFGRTLRQWWALDETTSREGFIIFGPGAVPLTAAS